MIAAGQDSPHTKKQTERHNDYCEKYDDRTVPLPIKKKV